MPWETDWEQEDDGTETVYAWDTDAGPASRVRVFEVDRPAEVIRFYPKDSFCVSEVLLEGFRAIPPEIAEAGYFKSLGYYLDKKLRTLPAGSFTISQHRESAIRKVSKQQEYRVVLNYADFRELKSGVTRISTEAKSDRSTFVDEHFATVFPTRFRQPARKHSRVRALRVVRNLDKAIIPELHAQDVNRLVEFVADVVATRYTAPGSRLKLMHAAKIKVDEVALSEVVDKFEEHLASNSPEATWGKFLRRNLFLVDSKYVGVIPELNVALASQRKADFGLVDTEGYLDIFEIKRPTTQLLSKKTDRGNYYWHPDATKAIVQAEKYLHQAQRKAPDLAEAIRRERGIEVKVVRPKAIVLLGHTEQLTNLEMGEDFRILRQSLKNVEIATYDELLTRLKNQQTKTYTEVNISFVEGK